MQIQLDRLLNTEMGKNAISVILGLGIASLFRKVCNDKNCIHFEGPILSDIDGKIFKSGDKCYRYDTEHVSCTDENAKSKQIIDIAIDNSVYAEKKKPLPLVSEVQPMSDVSLKSSWDSVAIWN